VRSPSSARAKLDVSPDKDVLDESCLTLLTPVCAQLLGLGFGVGRFLHAARLAYVSAATAAIRAAGERPSVSRVAALTGLQRKEVKLLLESKEEVLALSDSSPVMRVIAGWRKSPRYCSASGRPKALPLEGSRSFRDLVADFGGDVTPIAVLRELERLGFAKRIVRGNTPFVVSCEPSAFRGKEDNAVIFAERMAAYADALNSPTDPTSSGYCAHLESGPVDMATSAALSRQVRKRADEFLESMRRWLSRFPVQPNNSADENQLSLGIYLVKQTKKKRGKRKLNSRAKPA
jgi:hypothetical protein